MQCKNQELRRFRPGLGRLEERALLSVFTVTNLNDAGGGSLRRAVELSNLTPGADTIFFSPVLTGTIALTSGQLDLTDNVAILGPGANKIAVSGTNSSRIFETHGITATISGLTLQNAQASFGDLEPGFGALGGAIEQVGGALTVKNDVFVADTAAAAGGALFNFYGKLTTQDNKFINDSAFFNGGAIFNSGQWTSKNDSFTGNSVVGGGGAVANVQVLSIPGVTANLTGDTFTSNSAAFGGGAILNQGGAALKVSISTFLSNSAGLAGGGGAIYNPAEPPGGSVVVDKSTFLSNSAALQGGAISSQDSFLLTNSVLEFNTAPVGGAVFAQNGTFTPLGNTIQFNTAPEVVLV